MSEWVTEKESKFWDSQIALAESQKKFLENQDKISKEQSKLSKRQTEFSKILMFATVVLAIGTFLNLALSILSFDLSKITVLGYVVAFIFLACFGLFFTFMAFLIFHIARGVMNNHKN